MHTILKKLLLIKNKKEDFEAMLHHEESIELARQQKGFIAAEFG